MPVLVLALALLSGVPQLRDHFPDEGSVTHVFLLVDAESGDVVRAEGPATDGSCRPPWGDLERFLTALAGLENGTLDADRAVRCDSTCWAAGTHGEPSLLQGLAWGCDAWFADARARVPRKVVREQARACGLEDPGHPESATVAAWVEFWRSLTRDRLALRPSTTTRLLAAAGTSVGSPRGMARTLYDPHRRTRAIAAAAPGGAWVVGTRQLLGREWVFALWVPQGTPALATARAEHLLEDTRRIARRATTLRGGTPVLDPE